MHADMRPVVIASVTRPAAAGRYRDAAVYAALLWAIGVLRHQSMAAAEIQLRRTKDCMEKPGNWTKSSWDPQFIYWELIKACCLLHGYQVMDAV